MAGAQAPEPGAVTAAALVECIMSWRSRDGLKGKSGTRDLEPENAGRATRGSA